MKIYTPKRNDFVIIAEGEIVSFERLLKSYRLCQRMWLEVKYENRVQPK